MRISLTFVPRLRRPLIMYLLRPLGNASRLIVQWLFFIFFFFRCASIHYSAIIFNSTATIIAPRGEKRIEKSVDLWRAKRIFTTKLRYVCRNNFEVSAGCCAIKITIDWNFCGISMWFFFFYRSDEKHRHSRTSPLMLIVRCCVLEVFWHPSRLLTHRNFIEPTQFQRNSMHLMNTMGGRKVGKV